VTTTALAPPQDIHAERSVLAAMMLGREGVEKAMRLLRPASFHRTAHAAIFEGIVALYNRGDSVDLITLSDELERGDALKRVGGSDYLAGLLEEAYTCANVEAHAEVIVRAERQRELIAHARELAEAARESADPAATAGEFASRLRDASAAGASRRGLVAAFGASLSITPDDLNEPISLLGDGLICGGDLVLFAGQPSMGKSRLALEMAVAQARCERWMGLVTAAVPVRVGYMALEFDNFRWVERCVQVFGDGRVPKDRVALLESYRGLALHRDGGALHWLTRQQIDGGVDFTDRRGTTALRHAVEALSLNIIFVDALSRCMGNRDESNESMGELVNRLDDVRYPTNCAIVLIHHEKKVDDRSKTDRLSLVRGGTKLTAGVNTVITVSRSQSRMRTIYFDKANYAREPEPIHYEIPEEGGPTQLVSAPEKKADVNMETVWAFARANPDGVTGQSVAAGTGISERSARRLLGKLEERGLERVRLEPRVWTWRMKEE
jgi:hypothetical protein